MNTKRVEPFFVYYGEIFATQKDKIKVVGEERVRGFRFPGVHKAKAVNSRIQLFDLTLA